MHQGNNMLIYVNQLEFLGSENTPIIFNTIAGWLKHVTSNHFTAQELKGGNEYNIGKYKIRTYEASQYAPIMHSIMLTHPDEKIRGRYWVTEIGVKEENNKVTVTVLLETSDISTRVTEIPATTRPKLIQFLLENTKLSSNTIGLNIRRYSDSEADYKLLRNEIDHKDRKYPLVILSNFDNGKPLISEIKLQSQLLGLAQVVVQKGPIDSWEMERHLSKKYSSWGGAINIIFPSYGRDSCSNSLLLNNHIQEMLDKKINVNRHILSLITHTTNGFRKREHFSPTDVRLKRQRDSRLLLKEKLANQSEYKNYQQLAEEAFLQLDVQEEIIENLKKSHKEEIDDLEYKNLEVVEKWEAQQQENDKLSYIIQELKSKLQQAIRGNTSNKIIYPSDFVSAICERLTPELCLRIIEQIYQDKVIILESAFDTAKKAIGFKNTQKLFEYLSRLVTEYVDMVKNGGDSKAKTLFGDAYSANESETVERTPKLAKLRTFKYQDNDIQMFKHLRFGTSRNPEETLRVHFHWDAHNDIIVIGYCGEHLPVKST